MDFPTLDNTAAFWASRHAICWISTILMYLISSTIHLPFDLYSTPANDDKTPLQRPSTALTKNIIHSHHCQLSHLSLHRVESFSHNLPTHKTPFIHFNLHSQFQPCIMFAQHTMAARRLVPSFLAPLHLSHNASNCLYIHTPFRLQHTKSSILRLPNHASARLSQATMSFHAASGNGVVKKAKYQGEILCNRALNMSKIKAVGFDMDYTLAEYFSVEFETLSANNALQKLVYRLGYPTALLNTEYDHSFFIRGLVVDKENGNIIKLDRHKYVKRALHGFTPLSKEDRAAMYDAITTSGGGFGEPRFAVLDAMFAIPDAFLFSSIVQYKDRNPGQIQQDYKQIYIDVRRSVDMCHRDGTIKDRVKERPDLYIKRDPNMVEMLRQLKRSGRKVFLLTNSLWGYTDTVMKYLYSLEKDGHWTDLFDIIITGSCKPSFLVNARLPLYRVDPSTGLLSNTEGVYNESAEEYLSRGKCFQGGNYTHLHDMVGVANGTHLLYVGDHIFSDVLRSKRTLGWRTMLIVPELEHEINTMYDEETRRLGEEIKSLREERVDVDEWVDRLEGTLLSKSLLPPPKRLATETELEQAREELHALRMKIVAKVEQYHNRFHPTWGQLFKTGQQNSRFAEQVEQYACLYTSKVTNIGLVSPEIYWRAMNDLMPHDRLTASPMHRVLVKRADPQLSSSTIE